MEKQSGWQETCKESRREQGLSHHVKTPVRHGSIVGSKFRSTQELEDKHCLQSSAETYKEHHCHSSRFSHFLGFVPLSLLDSFFIDSFFSAWTVWVQSQLAQRAFPISCLHSSLQAVWLQLGRTVVFVHLFRLFGSDCGILRGRPPLAAGERCAHCTGRVSWRALLPVRRLVGRPSESVTMWPAADTSSPTSVRPVAVVLHYFSVFFFLYTSSRHGLDLLLFL
jgi:hypothetical protein